ncbi:MAG TPA: hypothetical protein VLE46_05965 [Nitrospira sp.]|nr:hypothetical protein [Nitrospira sp.]
MAFEAPYDRRQRRDLTMADGGDAVITERTFRGWSPQYEAEGDALVYRDEDQAPRVMLRSSNSPLRRASQKAPTPTINGDDAPSR